MYIDFYSEEITNKLSKLKKKDAAQYLKVRKKIDSILESPNLNYKFLHHEMKGLQRAHIGHFVLVFAIDHKNKRVSFEDYDHHDDIYL